jgi:hypothetical protein
LSSSSSYGDGVVTTEQQLHHIVTQCLCNYDDMNVQKFLKNYGTIQFSQQYMNSVMTNDPPKLRFERIVVYSASLVRLTLEKIKFPISKVWKILRCLQRHYSKTVCNGIIEQYSFRMMDMEETLAIIIETSKPQQS